MEQESDENQGRKKLVDELPKTRTQKLSLRQHKGSLHDAGL
jgi:hypothetical protein